MNELNCNVIKDLLPSYVDGICSEDSQKIIEQHILTCSECSALVDTMRQAEAVEWQKESKQIAYMKKIKRHIKRKELFALCMMFLAAGAGIWLFRNSYGTENRFYPIILPILLIDTYILLSDHAARSEKAGWKTILAVAGGVLAAYSVFLAFYSIYSIKRGIYPFGLMESQIGPFIAYQCWFLIFCQIAVLAAGIIMTLKTSNSCRLIIGISMTGIFLPMQIVSVLRSIESTVQSFSKMMGRQLLCLLLEGIGIVCIALVLEKRQAKTLL